MFKVNIRKLSPNRVLKINPAVWLEKKCMSEKKKYTFSATINYE